MKRLGASFLNPQTPSSRNAFLKSTNSGSLIAKIATRVIWFSVFNSGSIPHKVAGLPNGSLLAARWTRPLESLEIATVYFRRDCYQTRAKCSDWARILGLPGRTDDQDIVSAFVVGFPRSRFSARWWCG